MVDWCETPFPGCTRETALKSENVFTEIERYPYDRVTTKPRRTSLEISGVSSKSPKFDRNNRTGPTTIRLTDRYSVRSSGRVDRKHHTRVPRRQNQRLPVFWELWKYRVSVRRDFRTRFPKRRAEFRRAVCVLYRGRSHVRKRVCNVRGVCVCGEKGKTKTNNNGPETHASTLSRTDSSR